MKGAIGPGALDPYKEIGRLLRNSKQPQHLRFTMGQYTDYTKNFPNKEGFFGDEYLKDWDL